MEQYIKESDIVAEIKKTEKCAKHKAKEALDKYWQIHFDGQVTACRSIMSFLDTLEVEDVIEALRTEYEKGRADVIADTLSWLENCWPKYCSNQTIIEGFKEAIKGE